MATIAILRKHKSGNVTCGIYLVDLFSRGIKDTFFKFNEPENEVMERFLEPYYVEIQYNLAHNIIFGAYAFAKDFGFKAHPHFNEITQYLLEEDTEDIPLIEVEFGIDGKPLLFDVGADWNSKISAQYFSPAFIDIFLGPQKTWFLNLIMPLCNFLNSFATFI